MTAALVVIVQYCMCQQENGYPLTALRTADAPRHTFAEAPVIRSASGYIYADYFPTRYRTLSGCPDQGEEAFRYGGFKGVEVILE